MPPKAAAKNNEPAAQNYDDGSGVIKNIVNFKFTATVTYKSEAADTNIVFQWLNGKSVKNHDFGPIEGFTIPASAEPQTEDTPPPEFKTATAEISEHNVKIDLDFVKKLCETELCIYIVNTEEKSIYDMWKLDYSCI
jgi:hypothetical protein